MGLVIAIYLMLLYIFFFFRCETDWPKQGEVLWIFQKSNHIHDSNGFWLIKSNHRLIFCSCSIHQIWEIVFFYFDKLIELTSLTIKIENFSSDQKGQNVIFLFNNFVLFLLVAIWATASHIYIFIYELKQ